MSPMKINETQWERTGNSTERLQAVAFPSNSENVQVLHPLIMAEEIF
jgi:hypothetical protein